MNNKMENALGQFLNTLLEKSSFPAKLGDGNGNLQAYFEDGSKRNSFAWAIVELPTGSTLMQVRCRKVAMVYGSPVYVRKSFIDNIWEAFDEDTKTAGEFFTGNRSGFVANHAYTHGLYGTDPLRITTFMQEQFLTCPTEPNSTSVTVKPLFYFNDETFEFDYSPETNVSLASYIPTGLNEFTLVVVGLDKTTNTIVVEEIESNNFIGYSRKQNPFSANDLVSVALPRDFEPSAAVCLRTSMSGVIITDIFLDMRNWFGGKRSIVPAQYGGTGLDASGFEGYVFFNNGTQYEVRIIGAQISPPTVGDDANDGFIPGSEWYTATSAYKCVDNTVDAAVWVEFGGSGGGGMTSFSVQDDIATTTTITDGDTLLITGSSGIETAIIATDNLDISLATSGVTAGSYTNTSITVNNRGIITAASSGAASGTVTSVALSMPATFSVSGSPITTAGTFSVSFANQSANRFLAGPASGGATTPTWRAIVQGDIPLYSIDRNRMANMSALTVMGRYSNSVGVPQEIASSANDQFLVRRSSSLTFGTLVSADLTTPLTTPPAIGGTTPAAGTFTDLTVSDSTPTLVINSPTVATRPIFFNTNGVNRLVIYCGADAESGSNAGSNFYIGTYTDAGAFNANAVIVNRSNSKMTLAGEIQIGGALNHDGSTIGFYGTTPATKPTVAGSRGANEALYELLNALANLGLITNTTTG